MVSGGEQARKVGRRTGWCATKGVGLQALCVRERGVSGADDLSSQTVRPAKRTGRQTDRQTADDSGRRGEREGCTRCGVSRCALSQFKNSSPRASASTAPGETHRATGREGAVAQPTRVRRVAGWLAGPDPGLGCNLSVLTNQGCPPAWTRTEREARAPQNSTQLNQARLFPKDAGRFFSVSFVLCPFSFSPFRASPFRVVFIFSQAAAFKAGGLPPTRVVVKPGRVNIPPTLETGSPKLILFPVFGLQTTNCNCVLHIANQHANAAECVCVCVDMRGEGRVCCCSCAKATKVDRLSVCRLVSRPTAGTLAGILTRAVHRHHSSSSS